MYVGARGVNGNIGSEWIGPVADCCECGDEPSGSGATEWVSACKDIFKDEY
jgi:hypothetical protein